MEIEKLQVVIESKIAPIQQSVKDVQKSLAGLEKSTTATSSKMQSSFNKSIGGISKLKVGMAALAVGAVKVAKSLGSAAVESVTVDNQIQNLSRTMGTGAKDFTNWASSGAAAFGISERAAVSFGNQFSSIISRTEKNGQAVSDLSQEYLKMGAVIAANTHFEIDDVMGRIRSGLSGRNEAIEDLGIEVKPSVIKGTQAYAAAVKDGGVAWEHMTDAQQASVRTQAILEQAQKRYGTDLQGTAGKLAQLRAQISNMTLSWGRAFAPVIDFVIPVLSTLVGWLTTAASWARALLGIFFNIETKSSDVSNNINNGFSKVEDPFASMGNNLDKANKKAKNLQKTLFGFDVIHNVSEPAADSGAGGGIGGITMPDVDTSGLESGISFVSEFSKQVDVAREKVEAMTNSLKKWLPLVAAIAAGLLAFKGLDLLLSFGDVIPLFDGAITKLLNGPLLALKDSLGGLLGFFEYDLINIGLLKESFGSIFSIITEPFKKSWGFISEGFGKFAKFISPVTDVIGGIASKIGAKLAAPFKWFGSWFMGALSSLGGLLQGAFSTLLGWLQPLFAWFQPLISGIQGIFAAFNPITWVILAIAALVGAVVQLWNTNEDFKNNVIESWNGIKDTIQIFWDNVGKPIFDKLKATFITLWEEGLKPLWNRWVEAVDGMLTAIMDLWNESLKPIFDWFMITFGPVLAVLVDGLAKAFSVAFQNVATVVLTAFTVVANIVQAVIGVIQGIIDFVVGVFTGDWGKAWSGVVKIFSSVFGGIKNIALNVWNSIIGMFSAGGSIFKGFATSVADVFKKIVNVIIKGINNVIGAPFKALNKSFDTFRKISILGAKPFGFLPTISIPAIPQFATGGFPEDGLFFANSTELVGKFTNGKTAVANNDQIITGITNGVMLGVQRALAASSRPGQPINLTVQIGSNQIAKEIIDSIDNYTMETGLTFKTI